MSSASEQLVDAGHQFIERFRRIIDQVEAREATPSEVERGVDGCLADLEDIRGLARNL